MASTNSQLMRYHPTSFIDLDTERFISRDDMVSLLRSNETLDNCKQINDQASIHPIFDIDIKDHPNYNASISHTIDQYQTAICELFRPLCPYMISIAILCMNKITTKGPKLSIHCVVADIQMTINGLYEMIHDNIEVLELLSFDCGVYHRYMPEIAMC